MTRTNDIDLRKDVTEELEWEPSVDARTIGVAVRDGIVELTGHVATYAEKTGAEHAAKRVHGVIGVANDIDVRLPASASRDDVDIVRSAVNALEWNATVPKDRVKVTVTKGWVKLEGEVEWYFQKCAAEDTVRVLLGVRGVSNDIAVKAHMPRAKDVQAKIEAALKRSAEVDSKQIHVETTDGKVVLTGTVRSWIERTDAINAAWAAPGVSNVVDHIRIHA